MKYHVQKEAAAFAEVMGNTPTNYPVHDGLPDDFPIKFAEFRRIMRDMYADMAERPEKYGLKLLDISIEEKNNSKSGKDTIRRLYNTVSALCESGEVNDHVLTVSVVEFTRKLKERKVTTYELMLARLGDFGFAFSNFNGKPFPKSVESFTVQHPDSREMIDTMQQYFVDCRNKPNVWHSGSIVGEGNNPGYCIFPYVYAADHSKLSTYQAAVNYFMYNGYSEKMSKFFNAVYECSLQFNNVSLRVYYGQNNGCHFYHLPGNCSVRNARASALYHNTKKIATFKRNNNGEWFCLELKSPMWSDNLDPVLAAENWQLLKTEFGLEESETSERELRRSYTDMHSVFYHAFYGHFLSKGYKNVRYNGFSYFDADNTEIAYVHHECNPETKFMLVLPNVLTNLTKYEQEISAMPEGVVAKLRPKPPKVCSGHGSKHCSQLASFSFEGNAYTVCARHSIDVYDDDLSLIPYYWRLLEMEYGFSG